MTLHDFLRRHGRVLAVAVAGALLAFACSFFVGPTYQASTRLIIHGKSAGFLTSSGTPTTGTSITDSSLASALADTYASIATSTSTATAVVDRLALDKKPQGSGIGHMLSAAGSWLVRCTKAFVTSGFCASDNRRQDAIDRVQQGTTAQQLTPSSASAAGTPGSYVLEVTASGDSGAEAQAITNGVADQLVAASAQLAKKNADDYIKNLQQQLDRARTTVSDKAAAVTDYETTHNVSAADQQEVVAATSYDNLRAQLSTAQADLADAQAQLDSIDASLARTPSTLSTNQQINTARSGTTVTTDATNPAYTDLQNQRSATQAQISGLQARISTLQTQVSAGSPTALSGTLADLAALQADLTTAQNQRDTVAASLSQAQIAAATAEPDLSRIDSANRPQYPTSPKRYLYLLIGLLLGALAGGGLNWLARRRSSDPGGPDAAAPTDATTELRHLEFEDELLGGTLNGRPPRPREGTAPVGAAAVGTPADALPVPDATTPDDGPSARPGR